MCLGHPKHNVCGARCPFDVPNVLFALLLDSFIGVGGWSGGGRMLCRGGPGCLESPNHVVHGARCVLVAARCPLGAPNVLFGIGGWSGMWRPGCSAGGTGMSGVTKPCCAHAGCVLGVQNAVCAVPGDPWVLQMCGLLCFWALLLGLAAGARGGPDALLWGTGMSGVTEPRCALCPVCLGRPKHTMCGARCPGFAPNGAVSLLLASLIVAGG